MRTAKEYRSLALDVLRGNWKLYVPASLVVVLIILAVEIPRQLMGVGDNLTDNWLPMSALLVIDFVLLYPLVFSFQNACLEKFHGAEGSCTQHMFGLFRHEYKRGFLCYLYIGIMGMLIAFAIAMPVITVSGLIYVFGIARSMSDLSIWLAENDTWSTIIIGCILFACMIPVFIWYLSVSLTPFIAHELNNLSVSECAHKSSKLMRGHKWQLFCLGLSFIGWFLLSVLTLGIGLLWLLPYMQVSMVAFYDDILKEKGNTPPANPVIE